MTTTKKILTFVVAVIVGVAIYGAYLYPQSSALFGASAGGSTFATARIADVAVNLANPGANGTSTSILNTDTNNRYPVSLDVGCSGVGTSQTAYTGAGLAALTLSVATSSTAAPATNGNTNFLGAATLTIATTTTQFVIASSTGIIPGNTTPGAVWGPGSYLTFTFNATNTAACTVGVKFISA